MKWRPKFSLRTLVLLVIAIGCGLLLWRNGAAWRLEREIDTGPTCYARMSSNSRWLVAAQQKGGDEHLLGDIEVWDLEQSRRVFTAANQGKLKEFALTDDGRFVACLYDDKEKVSRLRVWETKAGKLIHDATIKEDGANYWENDFAISPDGHWVRTSASLVRVGAPEDIVPTGGAHVLVGCIIDSVGQQRYDDHLKLETKLATSATQMRDFFAHTDELRVTTTISPSRKWLLTSIADSGRMQVWDWCAQTKREEIPHTIGIFGCDILFLKNEEQLAIAERGVVRDACTRIVARATGDEIAKFPGKLQTRFVPTQQTSRDGNRIIVEKEGDRYCLWDIAAQKELWHFPNTEYAPPACYTVSPDGSCVAYDYSEDTACVDVATGNVTRLMNCQNLLQFGADSNCLYTQGERSVQVWRKIRPAAWWGVAWLGEFWAVVASVAALGWSVWNDRKYLSSR